MQGKSAGSRGPPAPGTAVLKSGRERPFLHRHPWIFSGAVRSLPKDLSDGSEVEVRTSDGRFVGVGLMNRRSQIRIRLYDWTHDGRLDAGFWRERIAEAVAVRERAGIRLEGPTAARLVFSEADRLSGLVVDRYGEWLVLQVTSLALAQRLETFLDLLEELVQPRGIVQRAEAGIAGLEGLNLDALDPGEGLLRGEAPPEELEIREEGLTLGADLRAGQKTGLYLDQRENRVRVARYARGRRMADLFCYTGGFGLAAARAGATRVDAVDASAAALGLARSNALRNGVEEGLDFVEGDVFEWLEAARARGERYGLVVLDPPRFASSRRDVPRALKGYRKLNALALHVLEPGGILATFSCSGRVGRDDFLRALSGAAVAAGRHLRVLETLGQPPDHPVSPACPETGYLKGFVLHVE